MKIGERKRIGTGMARGSLTVEASLALLIYVIFLTILLCLFFLIPLQLKIQAAMELAGYKTARYACAAERLSLGGSLEEEDAFAQLVTELGGAALSASWTKKEVQKQVGEELLLSAFVEGGLEGLSFWGTSIDWDEKIVDIVVRYEIVFPVAGFKNLSLPFVQRSRHRLWVGERVSEETADQEQMVYITPNGTVYHTSRECRHLDLSVHGASFSQIEELRNRSGAKYYACSRCVDAKSTLSNVWVTDYGTRYHSSLTCSALKRGVMAVPLSQAGERRPCRTCGESRE